MDILKKYEEECIKNVYKEFNIDISKSFYQLNELCNKYPKLEKIIEDSLQNENIRFFNSNEFSKIVSQNFRPFSDDINEFTDIFTTGKNVGSCASTVRQLSYSYDDVDILTGILPILKGTLNAEKVGGHVWLEDNEHIIDTTLMIIIDKSLKNDFGYIEEQRITPFMMSRNKKYQAAKEFTNDPDIKKK